MKSAPVISSNFLERIADPPSRFHASYLSYRNGEITKKELVARLPHVAMLGDSVCMDIYISSLWSTFWRAHTCRGGNWFFDNGSVRPGSPRRIRLVADIYSVSKDWKRSRLSLRSNIRESVRWLIMSEPGKIFFAASSERAIFPDKSVGSCERGGFPI